MDPAAAPSPAPQTAGQQILYGDGAPVLQDVMRWVGPRQWLYVARVSRRFRGAYLAAHTSAGGDTAQRTSYAAAVSTVATLLHAASELEAQLDEGGEQHHRVLKALGRAAGAHGSCAVADCAMGAKLQCKCTDVLVGAAGALRPAMLATVWKAMRQALRTAADKAALTEAALAAARSGDDGRCLNVLTLAREPEWDGACKVWPYWLGATLCAVAAAAAHLHTVRWFIESQDGAAAFGKVRVSAFLLFDDEIPWDAGDPIDAVMRPYTAYTDGGQPYADIIDAAAHGGAVHVVRYLCSPLHGHDCENLISGDTVLEAVEAGTEKRVQVAKELLSADEVCWDFDIGQLLCELTLAAPPELFAWARQNNIGTWSVAAMTKLRAHAQACRNKPLVAWLTEQLAQLGGVGLP